METDAVVFDLHADGHRVAFNQAFKNLGLECANWTNQLYSDIRRSGDGTPEGMIKTFFNTVGWPLTVTKADHGAFASRVLATKDAALQSLLAGGNVPLRPGVAQFIDDALADGARISLLNGTFSAQEEPVFSAVSFALGVQRARQMQPVSIWDIDEAEETLPEDYFAADAAAAQAKMKQTEAAAFVRTMKDVGVDPNILASTRSLDGRVLALAAQRLDVNPARCALLASTELTLQAARSAGLRAICVPAAGQARARPPSAQIIFSDGYGPGGGATWNRVRNFLLSDPEP